MSGLLLRGPCCSDNDWPTGTLVFDQTLPGWAFQLPTAIASAANHRWHNREETETQDTGSISAGETEGSVSHPKTDVKVTLFYSSFWGVISGEKRLIRPRWSITWERPISYAYESLRPFVLFSSQTFPFASLVSLTRHTSVCFGRRSHPTLITLLKCTAIFSQSLPRIKIL